MRTRAIWLAAALTLLVIAAWLLSRHDSAPPPMRPAKAQPQPARSEGEARRNDPRRTLEPLMTDEEPTEGRPRRDALLAALPTDPRRFAMVYEVGALMDSPVMRAWVRCEIKRWSETGEAPPPTPDLFGLDPMTDVDRLAVSSDNLLVVEGELDNLALDGPAWTSRSYGTGGTIYESPQGLVARWGNLALVSRGPGGLAALQAAIDRLESPDEPSTTLFGEGEVYGDVYGVVAPDALVHMLPPGDAALAAQIQASVERAVVHLDASEDVAMVTGLQGPPGSNLDALARSFDEALAASRARAESSGDERLAQLLDFATVSSQGDRLSVELALPYELLKTLGPCDRSLAASGVPAPPAAP